MKSKEQIRDEMSEYNLPKWEDMTEDQRISVKHLCIEKGWYTEPKPETAHTPFYEAPIPSLRSRMISLLFVITIIGICFYVGVDLE